jgi:hypothetical protein
MPDKKLTDSEIVKALECCVNWKKEGDCAKCPAYERPSFCIKEVRTRSLDLINRLQAENERLFADNQKYLSVILWGNKKHKKDCIKQIKAEAYKEFAEILCDDWIKDEDEYLCDVDIAKWIMDTCAELVGEDDVTKN